jgi:hypothetical protein
MQCASNVDSNYATNKDDHRSVSRALHMVGGTLLLKMQESGMPSSMEAEYVALSQGAMII